MLADPDRPQAVPTLAEGAAYGKGSVARALEMLTMAGIVQVQPAANRLLTGCRGPGNCPRPAVATIVFPDCGPFSPSSQADGLRPLVSGRRQRAWRASRSAVATDRRRPARLDIAEHRATAVGDATVAESSTGRWISSRWSRPATSQTAGATREITHVIRHLAFGGWLGTVIVSRRQRGSLSRGRSPGRGTGCGSAGTSDVQGCVIGKRHRRGGQRPPDDSLTQVSREFAEELLRGRCARGKRRRLRPSSCAVGTKTGAKGSGDRGVNASKPARAPYYGGRPIFLGQRNAHVA